MLVSGEHPVSSNMLTELLTFYMVKHEQFGVFEQIKKPSNR
jgi:hypothetical protein